MKVGFFSSMFWGELGSAKLARNLVDSIARNKEIEEVKILTIEPNNKNFLKDLKYDTYRVSLSIRAPLDRYEFLIKSLSYDKFFKDVDVIHAEHSFEGVLAQKCKKKYGIPFIFVREIISKKLPSLYSRLFLFNIEKFLTRHLKYDALVSPSKYMADNYFVRWGINPNKISIIPAGINTKEFKPKKKFKDIRVRYNIDKNNFLLFSIKILSKSNVLSLLKSLLAFNLFTKKYPSSMYIIAGIGNEKNRGYLKNIAVKLGISKKVIFVNYVPQNELPDYYINSDATAHFFSYETAASGSILESLACGIPPIATNTGEIPNILNDKCSILANPDIMSFANAMEKMYLLGEDGRKEMRKNARKLAENKFDINVIANQYVSLYKNILNNR